MLARISPETVNYFFSNFTYFRPRISNVKSQLPSLTT